MLAIQARIAAARGDTIGAMRSVKRALGLNIAAVVLYFVILPIAGLALGLGIGISQGSIQCHRIGTNIKCN